KAAAPPAGSAFESDQFLAELAREIDQLGMDSLAPSFSDSKPGAPASPPAKPKVPRAPSQAAEPGPLMEVFEEFRAELGEMGAEEEDLETHYNLGTAFREMGLLEEAISEFQKVAKASDNGRAFRYTMQCCTLLGLAFFHKGQAQQRTALHGIAEGAAVIAGFGDFLEFADGFFKKAHLAESSSEIVMGLEIFLFRAHFAKFCAKLFEDFHERAGLGSLR